jgi:hypothetical protein
LCKQKAPGRKQLSAFCFMVRLAGVEPEIYGLVTETLVFSSRLNLHKLFEKRFFIVFMKTLAFGERSMKSSTIGTNIALKHAPMGHVQAIRYSGGS